MYIFLYALPSIMGTHSPYLDRPLELMVERWAREHRMMKTVAMPDGSEVEEPDVPVAIVAIIREFLKVPKTEKVKG